MALRARDDADRRRAREPVDLDVVPGGASTWCRAATSAVACAIWQPVTSANDAPAGMPSSSLSQRPATSSATEADGASSARPAFWSQAEVSQSAASAAGTAPPTTKPK